MVSMMWRRSTRGAITQARTFRMVYMCVYRDKYLHEYIYIYT